MTPTGTLCRVLTTRNGLTATLVASASLLVAAALSSYGCVASAQAPDCGQSGVWLVAGFCALSALVNGWSVFRTAGRRTREEELHALRITSLVAQRDSFIALSRVDETERSLRISKLGSDLVESDVLGFHDVSRAESLARDIRGLWFGVCRDQHDHVITMDELVRELDDIEAWAGRLRRRKSRSAFEVSLPAIGLILGAAYFANGVISCAAFGRAAGCDPPQVMLWQLGISVSLLLTAMWWLGADEAPTEERWATYSDVGDPKVNCIHLDLARPPKA